MEARLVRPRGSNAGESARRSLANGPATETGSVRGVDWSGGRRDIGNPGLLRMYRAIA
jgi:hypothetical protein